MAGISPKLPISKDVSDGYALTKTYLESTRQNLKNLLLTVPGERMMIPEFGVGMKRFLFEDHGPSTYGAIQSKIMQQVSIYMPYIIISDIHFFGPDGLWTISDGHVSGQENEFANLNMLQMRLFFFIVPLDETGTLDLEFAV